MQRAVRGKNVTEYEILSEASKKTYPELQRSYSNLEKLSIFQHYGLPTRLVDVTYNPLVALWFACLQETGDKVTDGGVWIGSVVDIRGQSPVFAEIIADYLFSPRFKDNNSVSREVLNHLCLLYGLPKNWKCLVEKLSVPQFIDPVINSARLAAQQGAFVMEPLLKPYRIYDCVGFLTGLGEMRCAHRMFFKKLRIDGRHKSDILFELRLLGVNKSRLFPEMSNILSGINDCIKSWPGDELLSDKWRIGY